MKLFEIAFFISLAFGLGVLVFAIIWIFTDNRFIIYCCIGLFLCQVLFLMIEISEPRFLMRIWKKWRQ